VTTGDLISSQHHATTQVAETAPVDSRFSALNRWKLRLRDVPEAVSGGFSGAAVLKIDCAEGLFALRGWPEGTDRRRLDALHRLLEHVANAGVPVAVPLRGADGSRLQQHAARWWQVEPWLPGTADFRGSPTHAKLNAAVETLAAFHSATATFEPSPDESAWLGGPAFSVAPAIVERRMLSTRRLIGGEVNMVRLRVPADDPGEFAVLSRRVLNGVDRLGPRVHGELRDAESLIVPLSPVLRDVWHDHILFMGDRVTGLIDPSACRRDTVAADLSRLLGSMIGDEPERWENAVEAYRRHRSLSVSECKLIPVLDRSGVLLSAINWVRRRYLFDSDCDTPAARERLKQLLARIETMEA
jgi:homoserine kinase type II